MKSRWAHRLFSLTTIIYATLAGLIILSVLFFFFWKKTERRVEAILRDQFNRQQLELARKVASNVEAYFDLLEYAFLEYARVARTATLDTQKLDDYLSEKFERDKLFGILALRRYNAAGVQERIFTASPLPQDNSPILPDPYLKWAKNPAVRGRLFLSKTFSYPDPPWQGQRLMRFLAPLYGPGIVPHFVGALELIIDPFFICRKVTEDIRSGETGYAWMIDQDGIFMAHYDSTQVGQDAWQLRLARNPKVFYRGLGELQDRLLMGQEGMGEYVTGWHREQKGEILKLGAYTPIRFDKGMIRGVTDLEDPAHNLWGVVVCAPVAEVSGPVGEVLRQDLFLVGLFFLLVLLATGGLAATAWTFNRSLTRQVDLKTKELQESQHHLKETTQEILSLNCEMEALVMERTIAEMALGIADGIRNPLFVIGGFSHRLLKKMAPDDPAKDWAVAIAHEAKRLEQMVERFETLSRRKEAFFTQEDLNTIVQSILEILQPEMDSKDIRLVRGLYPHPIFGRLNKHLLKVALAHLLRNSIEATGPQGEIHVTTAVEGNLAEVIILDTGRGIPSEAMEKIFEPFYTTKFGGSGLGMVFVQQIVNEHRGVITLDSQVGQGTKVTIRLPLRFTELR